MKRIQRQRTKGFKLPENCTCINHGTKWGNPFLVSELGRTEAIKRFRECLLNNAMAYYYFDEIQATIEYNRFVWMAEHLQGLEGKILACFCKESDSCHGDVLIEIIGNIKN